MKLNAQVTVNAPPEKIWETITDIENAANVIEGINSVEVLEKPESGFVGFKWKEARTMMGKEATETMWVTAADENKSYEVASNSHGMAYHTVIKISPNGKGNVLSWEFGGTPQTFMAKLMGVVFGFMMKGPIIKMMTKDLNDLKKAIESK